MGERETARNQIMHENKHTEIKRKFDEASDNPTK